MHSKCLSSLEDYLYGIVRAAHQPSLVPTYPSNTVHGVRYQMRSAHRAQQSSSFQKSWHGGEGRSAEQRSREVRKRGFVMESVICFDIQRHWVAQLTQKRRMDGTHRVYTNPGFHFHSHQTWDATTTFVRHPRPWYLKATRSSFENAKGKLTRKV